MAWVDIAFAGIEEDLDIGVYYAGGTRGSFRQMLKKRISVEKGNLRYDQIYESDSSIYAFKPQSRTLRTEDANQQTVDTDGGACGVEAYDEDNIDRSFQLLIVGHGPATIRWIRPFAFLVPEDLSGDAKACEDETPVKALRFDGVGSTQPTFEEASADLAARALADFTAQKTMSIEQDGFLAVGVGHAQSIVSQEAADRVAEIIAVKMAENELTAMLPPITSEGKGFV
jgi:hypothetical protein